MLTENFIEYLRLELNYSANTVQAYRRDLATWADFMTGGKPDMLDPESITTSDLRLWSSTLYKQGLCTRSVKRKVQSVRAFYRYLMRNHSYKFNPAADIVLARTPKDLPVYVRPEETSCLLSSDAWDFNDFIQVRNKLIIDMFYSTGIRCSELLGLLDCNVDTEKGELKVHGKRNKDRLIPYGKALTDMITHYRDLRNASPMTAINPGDRKALFFVKEDGSPLYRKAIYNIVHSVMTNAGVHARRLSPHVLRHSFATDMLNSGAPITSVQQLLGHSTLISTQVYTHITYRELQQIYQHAHPRALKKGG